MPEIAPAGRADAFEVAAIRRQRQVKREDLVLREAPLDLVRADNLDQLRTDIALARLQHARRLHRDRRPARHDPA